MKSGTGYYDVADGKRHYRWWSADEPRWAIVFAHGFGDHSGRYQRFADTIVGFGGAVFVPDFVGHGLSDGERVVLDDFDTVASEYLQVVDVESFPSDVPLILAGQSMGGLIACRAAVQKPNGLAGMAISAARLGGWPTGEELLAAIDSGEVDPASGGGGHPLLDPNVKLPLSALCRDESIFEEFLNDPLTHRGAYPVETLRAYVKATGQLRDASAIFDFPVLYLHGGADTITPFQLSAQRIIQLASEDLEIHIFPGARHSIYNELNRDEVFEVLTQFIERAISVSPVGAEAA
jgi:alpha-beta hydrolase superfamily lysophospholipase